MPVTDYKRFQTLDSQGGWFDNNASSLLDGNDAIEIYLGTNPFAILSNVVSFGVPDNATITGVEGNIAILPNNSGISSTQVWSGKVSLDSLSESDLTDTLISIEAPTSPGQANKYSFGGENNLLGLSLTPSNVDNLKLGFKLTTEGTSGQLVGIVYGEVGDSLPPFDTPSPALRIHYTEPEPTKRSFVLPPVRSSGMYVRES